MIIAVTSLNEKIVRPVCLCLGLSFLSSQPGVTILYAKEILLQEEILQLKVKRTSSHPESLGSLFLASSH